jgi:hypothetical protein
VLAAGGGLHARRCSGAQLATGSGGEGAARRLGALGGDGLPRWLPRPAKRRCGAWLLWRRRHSAEGRRKARRSEARLGLRGEVAGVSRGHDRERSCRSWLGRPAAW